MAIQKTINQHYVPQFLLEGLDSTGAKKPKVHIFDLERNIVRQSQAIKEIFSQNYFYDKNNEIENFLSSNIEGPASEIINRIRHGDFNIPNQARTTLIKFMCCQNARTVEGREDALNFINAHFHQIVSNLNRLNNLGIKNPEDFNIRPSNKDSMRLFNAAQALNGVNDSKGMEDLEFHFLINKTNQEFIISDHAIARYNWLYRDLHDPRIGSMLAKGVQLFLPLSDKICLCAYDAKIYKYGNKSSNISELIFESDVSWMNQLQVRNAHSFIAFKSISMVGILEKMRAEFYGKKIYARKSAYLGQKNIGEERLKTTHVVYTEQVKLRDKPTFFKILKKSRNSAICFEERDPNISKSLMILKEKIRKDRNTNQPLKNQSTRTQQNCADN
ncbi:DUF4238 domain-containing protein [Ectopseudomonas mendocina]|uniref:DUF4238 domain-containing protein n=1 Tax=Ectopseudomonas mendocina TaxID=300 RepID=A0A2R3QIC7_ECTME|nr:DUF4238 domain-containing protein [Pseudomonas mendocina]AVO51541.1 hypothetical protein C7A17_01760 [Pseudomonas mendocina]